MVAFNAHFTLLAVSLASLSVLPDVQAIAIPTRHGRHPAARRVPLPLRARHGDGPKPMKRAVGESRRGKFLKATTKRQQAPFSQTPEGQRGRVDLMTSGTDDKVGSLFANTTSTPMTLEASRSKWTALWLVPSDDTHCSLQMPLDNHPLCATYDTTETNPQPLTMTECGKTNGQTFGYDNSTGVLVPIWSSQSSTVYGRDDDDSAYEERRDTQQTTSVTLKFVPAADSAMQQVAPTSASSSLEATTTVTVTVSASDSSASVSSTVAPFVAQALASSSSSDSASSSSLSSASSSSASDPSSSSTPAPFVAQALTSSSSMPSASSLSSASIVSASSSASSALPSGSAMLVPLFAQAASLASASSSSSSVSGQPSASASASASSTASSSSSGPTFPAVQQAEAMMWRA
ncbi:hypothetical protein C8F01DRAFT_1125816 [Mycena amicta]|nr:hypothetical protein C8F01DRAFT_1125816 [Mycena amicta]